MESWQFIESPTGAWYWLCCDVLARRTRSTAATFASRSERVADATVQGYGRDARDTAHTSRRHAISHRGWAKHQRS